MRKGSTLPLLLCVATANSAAADACDLGQASPWISHWLSAWELTSREIFDLPDAPAPNFVLFDSTCVYTTWARAEDGLSPSVRPTLHGTQLTWYAGAHRDSLTPPNGKRLPVALYSFTDVDPKTGPFFVMAAPSYWERQGLHDPWSFVGVFLHEFAHTRQVRGMARIIGPIDSTWAYPEELTDDAVQNHFSADSTYVQAYLAERDLLYRAAEAETDDQARAFAAEALAMLRARHERWFTGENQVFAILDDTFLSMEGSAQFAAVAWLSHSRGGAMTREAVIAKMLGRRRWWSQDEGLALFLVIDRLVPDWPKLVFREPSMGALELLEQAARQ